MANHRKAVPLFKSNILTVISTLKILPPKIIGEIFKTNVAVIMSAENTQFSGAKGFLFRVMWFSYERE